MTFVDIKKAFNNVMWDKLFDILKNIEITFKQKRTILNLYERQKATLKVKGKQGRILDWKENEIRSIIIFNLI